MDAPLYKHGFFGDDIGLLIGFVIGVGFGFFLERAGFGSGNKLARQFYFKDMAVLKVMFSAIVTAMVGVYWLSVAGFLNLGMVYLVPTALPSQVVGGLLLGGGFVIGGYCPGTSVVAAATGRIDAWMYMVGMFAGMVVVGFVMPELGDFMKQGSLGQTTLAATWDVPYGLLVAAVALMAFGAFLAAEWGEIKSGGRTRDEQSLLYRTGFSRPRAFVAGFLLLGLGAAVAGSPHRAATSETGDGVTGPWPASKMDPRALAERLVSGLGVPRIVDLRSAEAFAADRVPGAENLDAAGLAAAEWQPDQPVVLYGDDEAALAAARAAISARGAKAVSVLDGGLTAWNERVENPRLPENPTGAAALEVGERQALALYLGGKPTGGLAGGAVAPVPAPVAAPVVAPGAGGAPKKAKKKEGC
jgi:rhodanese-related sulfurtransferase